MAVISDTGGGGGNYRPAPAPVDPWAGVPPTVRFYMEEYGFTREQADRAVQQAAGIYDKPPTGGGASGPDHFFDVSGNTQATLDAQAIQDKWQNEFDSAEAQRDQANADRNYALSIGDSARADRAQQSSDYWQGISAKLEQDRMALTGRGQDMDYAAKLAGIGQQKYDSDQRFQVGMAGARNDEERNQIQARWNQEQAAIAKMEDETRRILGGQQNQTGQFQAETDRAASMGRLALDNNQFIHKASTDPRGLFSTFFMQRGVAPDWDTMAAGGTPAQGAAMVPSSVMGAYTPTTAAPIFNGTPKNASAANVGNATNYVPGSNEFIGQFSGSGDYGSGVTSPAAAFTPWTGSTVDTSGPNYGPQDINPGGLYGGVPTAGLKPGMNLSTIGGEQPVYRSSFGDGYQVYQDQAGTQEVTDPNFQFNNGQQVWIKAPGMAAGGAWGGPAIVGDQPSGKPTGHEELVRPILMQDGRPGIQVQPMNEKGIRAQSQASRPVDQMYRYQNKQTGRSTDDMRRQMMSDYGFKMPQQGYQRPAPMRQPQPRPQQSLQNQMFIPRFAIGTDNSAAYGAEGMGYAWLNDSDNTHLAGMDLPTRLQMLKDAGAPISPALAASATGGVAPTLNTSAQFTARGGGMLPSLQALGRQTKSETEHTRGYYEGVVGVPWADTIDFIGKPTNHLRTAQMSRLG